jgi:ABC-type tungstate transport system substrate-binding protein
LGHWGILFTPTAMVIAQSILVVPLIAALARALCSTHWPRRRPDAQPGRRPDGLRAADARA